MSEAVESAARRLAEARQQGESAEIAEALLQHANALIQAGQIGQARAALDEAAAVHASSGRTMDEARCLQMAATLYRFQGALDEAGQRVARALELVEAQGPIGVAAYAELGEIELSRGRGLEAAAQFRAALDAGGGDLADSARTGLLRKRAAALAVANEYTEAMRDLETAYGLSAQTDDKVAAVRILIEMATALQHSRDLAGADAIIQHALHAAELAGDHAALAEIHLLQTTQALMRRDAEAAMEAARAARTEALSGNAPASYIAAAHTISQLAESAGDRPGAYEALAVGWATIADLPHPSLARTAFEPSLREMRARWGAMAFDQIKQAYEASRRKMLDCS
jgi:tetratricopeptide (TPR) repeat protein